MAPTKGEEHRMRRIGWAAGLAAVLAVGGARAEQPRLGDVQKLKVITIAMQVGSTEKETKQVTYTPPPGWYVRSHRVECTTKLGNSSYSVNTVPRDWNWLSEEKVKDSYKALLDLAGKYADAGLQAKFALERDALLHRGARVQVQQPRPRRARLVVAVAARECHREAGEVHAGQGVGQGGRAVDVRADEVPLDLVRRAPGAMDHDPPAAVGRDVDLLGDVGAVELQGVGAGLALDRVASVAGVPDEGVVAGAHQGHIVAGATEHEVVPLAADEDVRAGSPVEGKGDRTGLETARIDDVIAR